MVRAVDVVGFNRHAWDREVDNENEWTIPVDSESGGSSPAG